MEKAVGIGLFALLVVGVAFVQVHYYRERQRAKAECERLEQSIGQMQKQYVDVVKQLSLIHIFLSSSKNQSE